MLLTIRITPHILHLMPIHSQNCVRLTAEALRRRYGINKRLRHTAPIGATIARYVRSCRQHNLLPELIETLHDLYIDIPLKVIIPRKYTLKQDKS